MESLMFMLMIFFWAGGAVLTAFLAHNWKHLSWQRWLIYGIIWGALGLFFVPWLLLLFMSKGDDGSEKSSGAQDLAQGAKYSYAGGATGIAVDTDRNTVRLKNGSFIKDYPFTDVREWRASLITGGQILGSVGPGLPGGAATTGANIRINRENAKASGFYIKVKDIDHPEWRIEMPNAQNQNRWMEILRQTINND